MTEPVQRDGGEGQRDWRSAERVARFLERQSDPQRQAEHVAGFERLLDLFPFHPDAAIRFVDLGAGAGALSLAILRRYPYAYGLLVEFSTPMMHAGAQSLADFTSRYRYIEHDMNSAEWPAELQGPFDAVVSSRAIHHLAAASRARVFGWVHTALAPGAVFANWDRIRGPDEPVDPSNAHEDSISTLEEQLLQLQEAGFVDLACTYHTDRRALISGRRA